MDKGSFIVFTFRACYPFMVASYICTISTITEPQNPSSTPSTVAICANQLHTCNYAF